MVNFLKYISSHCCQAQGSCIYKGKELQSSLKRLSFKAARRDTSQKPNSTIFIYMRAVRMELNNLNKTPLGVFDKIKNGNKIK